MMPQKCENLTFDLLRSGLALLIGASLALNGCAKQLTPFGKARQADTIEAYEEFLRTSPHDPRAGFVRDRIEVLRLLEAHKSGDATMAAPNRGVPEQKVTDRPRPTSVRQGPWNLTATPPRSSTFILDLYHGREAPVPHRLRIDQQGEQVTYTLQHGSGPNRYYLVAGVPFALFRSLWTTVVARDVASYEFSYGRMGSAADYRGDLVVEVDTGTERLSRTIRLEGLSYGDENLRRLVESMAQMHPGDHRIPVLR